jgi:hypothetical protein
LKISRRQIAQSKAEFADIANQLHWESIGIETPSFTIDKSLVNTGRLFKYAGKTWLLRCNVYATNYRLCTMKAARKRLEKLIEKKIAPAGIAARCSTRNEISSSYNCLNSEENNPEISACLPNSRNRVK